MKTFFAFLAIFVAAAAAFDFCPLEHLGGKKGEFKNRFCLSAKNQFKCAAFFENLDGSINQPIAWAGGVPDLLRKKSLQQSPEFLRSFGVPVTPGSFRIHAAKCNETRANARCYAFMFKASRTPLDACKSNLLNELGNRPIGESLCQKVAEHTDQVNQQNVRVGFYYSACGGPWKKVQSKDKTIDLIVQEPMCCRADPLTGNPSYYRCNGEPYTSFCPTASSK